MKKVFVSGGVSFNSVITLDEFPQAVPQTIHHCDFIESIGNTGAGKALTLSKLGFHTTLHALIGNDSFANKIRTYLEVPNLKFIADIDLNGTERHLNILNKRGERISIFINPSSDEPNIAYNYLESFMSKADFVVINISNYSRNLLPICARLGKAIWTDLHDYDGKSSYHQEFIDAADFIFLSSDNLPEYKDFMQIQIESGKKLVVCTHGKKGATALTADKKWIQLPAISSYKMINTNGAGDSFFSGFLFGFSRGYSVEKSLQFATLVAGLCVTSTSITYESLTTELIENEFQRLYKK